mgnify:CR=1 FL=1
MDYANGGYLKTVLDIKAGEQTVLSFRNEGEYETAVEDIYLDVIHREKAPYWVRQTDMNFLISCTERNLKQHKKVGITARV